MYVDQKSKKIGLSLLNTIINGQSDVVPLEMGQIIEDAAVVRIDKSIGLLLQLNDNLKGYVHVCVFLEVANPNFQSV